ncbi:MULTISPECIES: sensor histidine kinase [Rhizobium]|uniref:histidine kinase n=1 Tax=Rhizobium tropici TaxID=398 RepID=A0A329YF05_RHITR|nr:MULTISPECIES: sensor histidine kinase [Rhizobium]MBB3286502.1 two-component system sensor histidine kinase TctE [Rhizobium sp. BK252]MBB3401304.1 two-component system sensor histidine kinase TctE [Rhizobium sp. BK289]MBB3413882.1 two-component system sensor histidine kinase TctE [Rhizobium sp. BK284]MBB3481769.1 two-component system sensor histidine kinase TctE [Rhizobium sp. BK347]MDK4719638.1 sensor histidine kinase [Rhizobium sp. CNPSo 3968]
MRSEASPPTGLPGRLVGALTTSLRAQLFAWVVLTLIGAICINLYLSFRSADATADLVTDRTLLASARVIAEAVHVDASGTVQIDIPPAALEMFDTGYGDRVFYQVVTAWGNLVAGFPDLPRPKRDLIGEDRTFRSDGVRVLMLSHPVVGLDQDSTISVAVAVTHNSQYAMRRRLWLSDFTKQLALVLLAGVVTIIGLQRGLAPVLRLRDAVRARGRQRLDPLDPHMVQNELRPLVHALNDHMERVQNQMAAQRRFVSNAAHQLRTPLALISTQASVAAREADTARRDEALTALRSSTRQVTRLASQLLTLSRAEPGSRRPRNDTIDLAETARRVLETLAEEALRRDIDLGLEADEKPVHIEGDGTMLREMLVNLVDNALRYTQAGGRVTVGVGREGDTALLWVEDNGPGIPEAERSQVFERFYRIMGTEPEGSGLGLAIVREVVDGAGGSVTLGEATGGGLLVRVRLPAV